MHRAYIPAQDIIQSGTSVTASVMLRESASSVIVVVANAPGVVHGLDASPPARSSPSCVHARSP